MMLTKTKDVNFVSVASGLFALSTFCFIRWKRKQEKKLAKYETNTIVPASLGGRASSRGIGALSPPIPYINDFLACLEDPCDPKTNPTGHIALCVAENKLVTDLIAERIVKPSTIHQAFVGDPSVYAYDNFMGRPDTREAVAYFLTRRFLKPDDPSAEGQSVHPDHIVLGSGCACVLNMLFFTLGEKGDCVLIPAPYYAAFENDMKVVSGLIPFAVECGSPVIGPTVADLERGRALAISQGLRPRHLLLTNPHNPLGIIYRPDIVFNAITWSRKHKMHTIVDEIYALSTHKNYGHGFESVIRIMNNQLNDDVHFVWAMSKDFGASGLRIGVMYSQNEVVLHAAGNLNIFSNVSHPMQSIVADLLTDDAFVDSFLDEMRERLHRNFIICITKLEEMVIPYIPAEAGLFVYTDFSSLLPERSMNGEAMLASFITKHARVVLTPGSSQRDSKPGMFRICYAWVHPDILMISMERLSRLVAKIRKFDWEDLNQMESMSGILKDI